MYLSEYEMDGRRAPALQAGLKDANGKYKKNAASIHSSMKKFQKKEVKKTDAPHKPTPPKDIPPDPPKKTPPPIIELGPVATPTPKLCWSCYDGSTTTCDGKDLDAIIKWLDANPDYNLVLTVGGGYMWYDNWEQDDKDDLTERYDELMKDVSEKSKGKYGKDNIKLKFNTNPKDRKVNTSSEPKPAKK